VEVQVLQDQAVKMVHQDLVEHQVQVVLLELVVQAEHQVQVVLVVLQVQVEHQEHQVHQVQVVHQDLQVDQIDTQLLQVHPLL